MGAAAQPTIIPADMPLPGQSVVYRLFDTIPPLASGSDVVWEIHGNGSVDDSVAFFSPAGQPGTADFPDATLMMTMTQDPAYRSYYKTTSNTFEYLGYHFVGGDSYFDDPSIYLQFPCSQGTAWSDAWGPIGETIQVDLIADGWGTLMSEATSWSNVLKVHGSSLELDTMVAGVHYESILSMDYFWRSGEPFYLAYVHHRDYLVDGVPDVDITKTHARVRRELVTGVADHSRTAGVNAFPNPATDMLYITTRGQHLTGIALLDMTGREVAYETIGTSGPSGTVHTLNLRGLSPGMYVARCSDVTGNTSSTVVTVH